MRYFIECSYNGKNYHGWQIQNNAITVQETFEKALTVLLKEKISVIGAGRTDTGVHAKFFTAHFDIESEIPETEKLIFKLNRFLPSDIAVSNIFRVKDDLHARFSAISRTYKYFINFKKNPFENETSYYINYNLDFDKMNQAAEKLFDYIDFTSFSKLHTDTKTNNCEILFAKWHYDNLKAVFEIKADRFLRNMVRAIVGTLLEVGKNKISIKEFCEIIESKSRSDAGFSVPAHALFLTDIKYPNDINLYKHIDS
jgi:tRNA pseudouridine38-40 synthase